MSRSGYCDDDYDPLASGRWRAQVASSFRGKRGQAFLKEMLAAMDAMPEKRLIAHDLIIDGDQSPYSIFSAVIVGGDKLIDDRGNEVRVGDVCAMGTVAKSRGLKVDDIDPHDSHSVGVKFDIAHQMAAEIAYMNDEFAYEPETPEQRFERMRNWIASEIKE